MTLLIFKRGPTCRICCIWNQQSGFAMKTVFGVPWNELHEFIEFKKPKKIQIFTDDY